MVLSIVLLVLLAGGVVLSIPTWTEQEWHRNPEGPTEWQRRLSLTRWGVTCYGWVFKEDWADPEAVADEERIMREEMAEAMRWPWKAWATQWGWCKLP